LDVLSTRSTIMHDRHGRLDDLYYLRGESSIDSWRLPEQSVTTWDR
jgi:hypothetical protein